MTSPATADIDLSAGLVPDQSKQSNNQASAGVDLSAGLVPNRGSSGIDLSAGLAPDTPAVDSTQLPPEVQRIASAPPPPKPGLFLRPEERTGSHYAAAPNQETPEVRLGRMVPESAMPALAVTKKYAIDPFEKMAAAGAEAGRGLARDVVTGADVLTHPGEWGARMPSPYGPTPSYRSEEQMASERRPIAMGVASAVGSVVGGTAADPRNWPFFASSAARPILQRLISGGFGAQMSLGAIDAAKNLYQNWDKLSPSQRAELATQGGLTAAMAAGSVSHALSPTPAVEVRPTRAELAEHLDRTNFQSAEAARASWVAERQARQVTAAQPPSARPTTAVEQPRLQVPSATEHAPAPVREPAVQPPTPAVQPPQEKPAAKVDLSAGLIPIAGEQKFKYGSTQANIPDDSEAAKALDTARQRIAPGDLAAKGTDVGGNHLTVRYGIKGDDVEGVRNYLRSLSPFEAMLGKTEKFEPSDSSDGAAVIHAPVEASELHKINAEIAKHGDFAESNFKEYTPHATIAYVRPDAADRYVGMAATEGKKFLVKSIAITDRQGNAEEVPLSGNVNFAPFSETTPKQPAITKERRQDVAERKRVSEMSPQEMKRELLTSRATGLPDRRAFDEAGKSGAVGMSDADGLKAFNDRFGYEAGNALLRAKADALKAAGLDAYHDKGDEFLYRGTSPEDLQSKLEAARNIFRNKTIEATLPDGTVKYLKGVDFSYGTGEKIDAAETALKAHKAEREARGERVRGGLPGVVEAAQGNEVQSAARQAQVISAPRVVPGARSAATGSETGTTSIQDLTESIRRQATERTSLKTRLNLGADLGEQAKSAKDEVTATFGRVKGAAAALWDAYKRPPKWTDYEDATGKWSGADQVNALDLERFTKAIKDAVPDKLRREAISNWIEAGGDDAILRERADKSERFARPSKRFQSTASIPVRSVT